MDYKERIKKEFRNVTANEISAILRIYVECEQARKKFRGFNSEYEAYGVIIEA